MHNGVHVSTRLVDLAMNEPLDVEAAAFALDRIAVEIKFHDIGGRDQFRCDRTRQKVSVGIAAVANADVAEPIQNSLLRENPVGRDEVFNQFLHHARSLRSTVTAYSPAGTGGEYAFA